jgi:hypothetical protein
MATKKPKRKPILVSDLVGAVPPKRSPAAARKRKTAAPPPDASTAYEFVSPTHGQRPRKAGHGINVVQTVKRAVRLGRTILDRIDKARR